MLANDYAPMHDKLRSLNVLAQIKVLPGAIRNIHR